MNKFLGIAMLAASIVTGSSAFGRSIQRSQVLAEYTINLPATSEQGLDFGLLTLKDDRTLTIKRVRYTFGSFYSQVLGTKKVTLSKAAMDHVVYRMIANLSTAEVKEVRQDFVCMMMPMPGPGRALTIRRGFDYESRQFRGALETVNDNTGCWSPVHINFANDYDQTVADQLETALEVLALQNIGS